jgi:hypothetical protein
MTAFIESFATHQVLPPWTSAGAMTWGFVVQLGADRIQAYLDAYFNGAYPDTAPYAYSSLPEPQFGVLFAVCHPLMWSEYPGNPPGWDSVTVTEVYLGVPVLRRPVTPDNIILDDPTVVWIQPFMFANNASVVFGSREIWGTDMEYAVIVRDEQPAGRLHLDVAIEAIKTFNPRSVSQLLSVLHLRTNGFSAKTGDEILAAEPDLAKFLELLVSLGVFSQDDPAPEGEPDAVAGGAEVNNLKQFRDVFNMSAAVYRAIVAAETTHVNVQNVQFFDADQVEIDFMWSDSIGELLREIFGAVGPSEIGPPRGHEGQPSPLKSMPLAGQAGDIDWNLGRLSLKAELGFEMRSDVHFKVMKTLYTYGV